MGQNLSSLDSRIQENFAELVSVSSSITSDENKISSLAVECWNKFKKNELNSIDMAPLLQFNGDIPAPSSALRDAKLERCKKLVLTITKLLIQYNKLPSLTPSY